MTDVNLAALQTQVLEVDAASSTTVAHLDVQVLMPTQQVNLIVDAVHAQVLVSYPWTVSASDGTTPIEQLHTDGVWRPLYIL